MPKTLDFVSRKLREYGLEPVPVGRAGISCTVGKPGKTVLLRADMDALPMREETGLPFSAQNGNCHSCGHDCHAAMLLGAAKLLKQSEDRLAGMVKLMFQPTEELLAGARDMIAAGILDNPRVDAAIGMHIMTGSERSDSGTVHYTPGAAMYSGGAIRITVSGRNAHGSTPEKGVDAISIAAHIVIALQEIISRELSCADRAVLIVGTIHGGDSCNTLAGHAVLEASLRTADPQIRAFLKTRIKEVAESVASTFRGSALVEFVYGIGSLRNDPDLSRRVARYCARLVGDDRMMEEPISAGSEDFAYVAEAVPAVMLHLGAGSVREGHVHSLHHPGMVADESVLPLGAALYAHCAASYLENGR